MFICHKLNVGIFNASIRIVDMLMSSVVSHSHTSVSAVGNARYHICHKTSESPSRNTGLFLALNPMIDIVRYFTVAASIPSGAAADRDSSCIKVGDSHEFFLQ